jgi:hypothetical protein
METPAASLYAEVMFDQHPRNPGPPVHGRWAIDALLGQA